MATSGPKKRKPPVRKAPAKDLKPGDSRKKFAEGPKKDAPVKKTPSGTLTDRMGEAKSRPNKGLPARTGQPRGNLNRANPPKEIRLGGQGGTSRSVVNPKASLKPFKPFPLGNSPKLLGSSAGAVARAGAGFAATRALQLATGPAGFLVGMTTEAGRDSDKPSGKLFSPSANRAAGKGNSKTVNPYGSQRQVSNKYSSPIGPTKPAKIPARGEARGGMKSTLDSYRASKGINNTTAKAAAPKPKARPDNLRPSAPPKPKARPSVAAPAKEMTFQEAVRRNETEAYIRNKMRPKGNLLDLIRNKKKK